MILIVDDRPENIYALRSILEQNGFDVDEATSGEEALKKVLIQQYSLIVLDVQMPDMDGFETAEFLGGFSKSKDTPIIFLSAISKEKKFVVRGYESGAMDYITKPVDPDILLMKVRAMVQLSEQKTALKRIQEDLEKEVDIRKKAEEETAIRNSQLRSIMESLSQITFTINPDGAIEYVNSSWFLYSGEVGKFPAHHPDDGPVCEDWEIAFKNGEAYERTVRLKPIRLDDYRYFKLVIQPIYNHGNIVNWIGTFSDIHDQKTINDVLENRVEKRTHELKEKNRELEISNNELQQFAWVISHDLKEPIRKIMTFTDLVKHKYLQDNQQAQKEFDRIIRSANRMSSLISDLLDFTRISIPAKFERVSLDDILMDVLYDYEEQIQECQAIIEKSDLPEIDAVPSQIRQVFQNLISNSLKFTEAGTTPRIMVSCELINELNADAAPDPAGKVARLTFQDNGIGFDEQYLEKIFLVFQRLIHERQYEGTGIGLAIARKSIEKHHGLITAKSEIGKGTSFIICLPLQQENTERTT